MVGSFEMCEGEVVALVEAVVDGTFTSDTLIRLRNSCVDGPSVQSAIAEGIPMDFFLDHLTSDDTHLLRLLQLLCNLCVQYEPNQDRFFQPVTAKFAEIAWTVATATPAMHFIISCMAPGSSRRRSLTVVLIEPFLELPDDDNLEFLIISVFPAIACEVVRFALAHERICMLMLDRLSDAVEQHPEDVDAEAFVALVLSLVKREKLEVPLSKSKIVGIFCVLIGGHESARQEALRQEAPKTIMDSKLIDRDDQILLEWNFAALRILKGELDED